MKRTIKRSIALAALLAVSQLLAQTSRTADVQFKAAQSKEQVEGDLKGAIEQYKKLADGKDRAIAAKALIRMGECYEKLGQADSRKAYERVVREFADQAESVSLARTRLTALQPAAATSSDALAKRLVCTDCGDGYVGFDARFLVSTDWASGDLAVRDLVTGEVKRLPTKTDSGAYSWLAVMSPDTRQVAYQWVPAENSERDVQLRVMATETGAKSRTLLQKSPEDTYYKPFGWSADNRYVFVVVQKSVDGTWQLVRVSVADGSVTPLKSLQWRFLGMSNANFMARVSPDGRYIAYSALAVNPSKAAAPSPSDSRDQHIYILATDGSSESEVVKTSGSNWDPVWTSDGKQLLFLSNRSGARGLWSIPIENGKATAAAALVMSNLGTGSVEAIGMTRSGSYYYAKWSRDVEQIAVADLRSGKTLETFVGANPSWSPDGKSIAFKRHRLGSDQGVNDFDLVVHSLEGGDENTLPEPLGPTGSGQPEWFHDNKGILTGLTRGGAFRVDLQSGEWRQLPPPTGTAGLSLDDKTQYGGYGEGILAVDVATGTYRQVIAVPNMVPAWSGRALSPDGRTLAFWSSAGAGKVRLNTVGVDGSSFREVDRFDDRNLGKYLFWSPDGQAILVALKTADKWRIQRIPVQGGQPEFTGIETAAAIQAFSLNPDGSRIVYSSVNTQKDEVWAVDNIFKTVK